MTGGDAKVKIDLPYLTRDRGRFYVRARKWRRKIRIKREPGSAEFFEAYHAAVEELESERRGESGETDPASLSWLVRRYYASSEFRGLAESTQYVRRGILDRLLAREGAKPFARMEPKHLRARRDAMSERPEAANAMLKALRAVFAWGLNAGHVERNPTRDVPLLRSANPEGFHTWTQEEIEQFEANHPRGSKPRLAIALLLSTGARRSDAVKLGRQNVRDGWLRFVTTKGSGRRRTEVCIPILPELQAELDQLLPAQMVFLMTERGHPYCREGFGNWFKRQCRIAGLDHCSAHGLRKASATRLADVGATPHQLMAVFGWESLKVAELYTRQANRRRLAGDAMGLIQEHGENRRASSDASSVSQAEQVHGKKG
jgi:integrase